MQGINLRQSSGKMLICSVSSPEGPEQLVYYLQEEPSLAVYEGVGTIMSSRHVDIPLPWGSHVVEGTANRGNYRSKNIILLTCLDKWKAPSAADNKRFYGHPINCPCLMAFGHCENVSQVEAHLAAVPWSCITSTTRLPNSHIGEASLLIWRAS